MDDSSRFVSGPGEARDIDGLTGAVRAELTRVLGSRCFSNAPSLSRFLTHIVDRTLEGKAGELKEYSLGVDVFGRGEQFDAKLDTIVRVQARRLRQKLEEYYQEYVAGRYLFERFALNSINKSLEHFNRAIALDSDFALPYATKAQAYIPLVSWGAVPPRDGLAQRNRSHARHCRWTKHPPRRTRRSQASM